MTNKDQIIYGRTPETSFPVVYFAPNCSSTESNGVQQDPTNRSGNELKNVCRTPQHESIKVKTFDIEFERPPQNFVTIDLVVDGATVGTLQVPTGTIAVTYAFNWIIGGDSLFTYRFTGTAPGSVITTVIENLVK